MDSPARSSHSTSSPSRSSPYRSSPTPSSPSSLSRTSESSSESPPHQRPAKRGRFSGPHPRRTPSPVRCNPSNSNQTRGKNRSVLYHPWKNPMPGFVPQPRNFIPGEVKTPTSLFENCSVEETVMAERFIKKIKIQHNWLVKQHVDLVKQIQENESAIRRLEVEPKDWANVVLSKISPMPMFLRDYCDNLQAKGGD